MSNWGKDTYGDPCECGYAWSISADDADAIIAGIETRLAELLAASDGTQRSPALGWSAKAYVWHVGDNIMIWAERLAGLALAGESAVHPYDPDALAVARGYEHLSITSALWSLQRSVQAWRQARQLAAGQRHAALVHPARGVEPIADVAKQVAHDAHHHAWDIQRCLQSRAAQ